MKTMKGFELAKDTYKLRTLLICFSTTFLLHLALVWLAGNADTPLSCAINTFLNMLNLLTADLSLFCIILSMLMYHKVQSLLDREEANRRIMASMQADNKYKEVGLNMQIDISQNPTETLYDLEQNIEKMYELTLSINKYVTTVDKSSLFEERAIGLPNFYQKAKIIIRYLHIQITTLEIQTKNAPSLDDFKKLEKQQQDFISYASKIGYRD